MNLKFFLALYNFKMPVYLVYMLQQVEYKPSKYFDWLVELSKKRRPINGVMYRKTLIMTTPAKLLLFIAYLYIILAVAVTVGTIINDPNNWVVGVLGLGFIPLETMIILYITSFLARIMIVEPQTSKLVSEAKDLFDKHKGVKIAVLGSYGKTSMKEILTLVLSEGLNVASTPGNMNTLVSQSRFSKTLTGEEDVLIIEFGEGQPGDIKRMSELVGPNIAIITGLAPNHLDEYKSLKYVAQDLLSIYDFVDEESVYATKESEMLKQYLGNGMQTFSSVSVAEWRINSISTSINGVKFKMQKGKEDLNLKSRLLGEHQIAPLALSAMLAEKLGLNKSQIQLGISKTVAFEHRMEPRELNRAQIIDDTYNGNLEGMKAGLKLLSNLDYKRKWYVTPGLVDQGEEFKSVHVKLGELIYQSNPDIVVLMDNSACPIIKKALSKSGYKGEMRILSDPLDFYTSLEHQVADGDLVLMQNDWTDNYF